MPEFQVLPRTVGFWGAALFPVNGMVGAGIFALPAIMVAAVGNFAPWMMLFGALLILPLTFSYSLSSPPALTAMADPSSRAARLRKLTGNYRHNRPKPDAERNRK